MFDITPTPPPTYLRVPEIILVVHVEVPQVIVAQDGCDGRRIFEQEVLTEFRHLHLTSGEWLVTEWWWVVCISPVKMMHFLKILHRT